MKAWTIVTAVCGVLLVGAVGALIFLLVQMQRESATNASAAWERLNKITHELEHINAPPHWVKEVGNECTANKTEMTCTFTNVSDTPVSTCMIGGLLPKQGNQKALKSIPVCTGKLEPHATKTIIAPWSGAFADEVCGKDTGWGRVIDWSKCEFAAVPYTPPGVTID